MGKFGEQRERNGKEATERTLLKFLPSVASWKQEHKIALFFLLPSVSQRMRISLNPLFCIFVELKFQKDLSIPG